MIGIALILKLNKFSSEFNENFVHICCRFGMFPRAFALLLFLSTLMLLRLCILWQVAIACSVRLLMGLFGRGIYYVIGILGRLPLLLQDSLFLWQQIKVVK